jgi:hypothetical protein
MYKLTYTQLAQHRENSTNPVSLYQCGTGETAQCFLKIANVSDNVVEVRVFHDQTGSTYDETTAIVWNLLLCSGQLLEIDHIFIDDSSGNLAYRTDTANAINATLYGIVR